MKIWTQHQVFHESDKESENFCQEIKNATIQEPITKEMEWDVQELEKGIFIGDSAATSHMTSDMK